MGTTTLKKKFNFTMVLLFLFTISITKGGSHQASLERYKKKSVFDKEYAAAFDEDTQNMKIPLMKNFDEKEHEGFKKSDFDEQYADEDTQNMKIPLMKNFDEKEHDDKEKFQSNGNKPIISVVKLYNKTIISLETDGEEFWEIEHGETNMKTQRTEVIASDSFKNINVKTTQENQLIKDHPGKTEWHFAFYANHPIPKKYKCDVPRFFVPTEHTTTFANIRNRNQLLTIPKVYFEHMHSLQELCSDADVLLSLLLKDGYEAFVRTCFREKKNWELLIHEKTLSHHVYNSLKSSI